MLRLSKYQKELVQDLETAAVEYVVIGGKAMQAHGLKRESYDLDVWVSHLGKNPDRLLSVLSQRVTETESEITQGWLACPGRRVTLAAGGDPSHEVDILTSMHDLDFPSVLEHSVRCSFGDLALTVASPEDLACIKRLNTSKCQNPYERDRDQADLRMLEQLAGRRVRAAIPDGGEQV